MTDQPTLSGEEVAALMSEIGDHAPRGAEGGKTPRPFVFGNEAARPMAGLPALDRMNERIAKRLRGLLEPYLRIQPKVTAEPVAVRRFEAWRSEQSDFTALSLYRFAPLNGGVLLALRPEFVARLVDSYYGGSGLAIRQGAREFTATEERVLARLTDAVMEHVAAIWADIAPVRPQLSSRETNIAFATLARDDEPVALARFVVETPGGKPATIDILYPVAALRTVESELAARLHEDASSKSEAWRKRLNAAVGEVRIEARTVLARPELSVPELMRLAPGDVIPISLPSLVPLLVAGRPIAQGTIGDNDGRAALKIEKIESRRSIP